MWNFTVKMLMKIHCQTFLDFLACSQSLEPNLSLFFFPGKPIVDETPQQQYASARMQLQPNQSAITFFGTVLEIMDKFLRAVTFDYSPSFEPNGCLDDYAAICAVKYRDAVQIEQSSSVNNDA